MRLRAQVPPLLLAPRDAGVRVGTGCDPRRLRDRHQVLENHYRSWPDIGLPALDGCSPREAARDPALRPRLVSLLKDMELSQSRASGPMATFDLSFLWNELGLRRP